MFKWQIGLWSNFLQLRNISDSGVILLSPKYYRIITDSWKKTFHRPQLLDIMNMGGGRNSEAID